MPNVFQGDPARGEGRFAVVVSRYNDSITSKLLDGAVRTLREAGVADGDIDVAWVPGAWEIPLVAARFAEAGSYRAVLCLGAVIRGETTHDQHINRQVSLSLGEIALRTGVPVLFGVLTCNTIEQAIHRAGGNVGNKGVECAQAALDMASLLPQLPLTRPGEQRPFEVAERRQAAAAEALGPPPSRVPVPEPAPAAAGRPPERPPGPLNLRKLRQRGTPPASASQDTGSRQPAPVTRQARQVPPAAPSPPAESLARRKRAARQSRRSRARQVALQVLYEDDLNPQRNLAVSAHFLRRRLHHEESLVEFAEQLVAGVRRHRGELDQILGDHLQNWTMNRVAATDRNVLRLGAYEILFGGTPGPVAINEAVELARRFGSQHSAHFVNGVLDKVFRQPVAR